MKAIAERRPGRSKLVYDKTKRTIVAVTKGSQAPRALNITADDADMFAVATLSTQWLTERWGELTKAGAVAMKFSSWDKGDALTQFELGPLPADSLVDGVVTAETGVLPADSGVHIVLHPGKGPASSNSTFVAPDGSPHHATARVLEDGNDKALDVHFVDLQPRLTTQHIEPQQPRGVN